MLNLFTKLNPVASGIIGIIVAIFVLTVVVSLILKKKYTVLEEDINDNHNRAKEVFGNEIFNSMVTDYKKAISADVKDVNTQAIIEKNMHKYLRSALLGERFLTKAISLMIVLGLLGTFYGLTLSIGELVLLLNNASEAVVSDVSSITDGLISSIQGMSVAFVTSLFGIASSILVTILNIAFSVKEHRESVMVFSEEYLDNIQAGGLAEIEGPDGVRVRQTGPVATVANADNIIKDLTDVSEKIIKEMNKASYEMAGAVNGLNKTIHQFDSSLKLFSEGSRDLTEFNHELRTNIQRMNVTFDDFSKEMSKNTESIADSSNAVFKLSVAVEKLGDKVK
jgi:biopolymer transport protein ExbB/TolQ/soluble cytochrome b562